jgi:chemotaxis protein methyltransferase CheR
LLVGDPEFGLLREFIHREAGIYLSDAKRALLAGRLAPRLRRLGCASFLEYWHLVGEQVEERRHLLEAICTHETQFFRELPQLRLLESWALTRWQATARAGERSRRLRVWCAGCSSGEEPFTLAMLLRSGLPPEEGWSIDILATDLSERVLEKAREAVYPVERIEPIPEPLRRQFMLRGVGARAGFARVADEIRGLVRFERLNLAEAAATAPGPFDLISCRNVLIYFRPADRRTVVERLVRSLDGEGLLLVGHSESLRDGPDGLRSLGAMTYCRERSGWQRPTRQVPRRGGGQR